MIDTEIRNQCFTKYTEFACFPKNYIRVSRDLEPPLCIARVSDPDFISKHGFSNNIFRFKAYNLPLLLKALHLPLMIQVYLAYPLYYTPLKYYFFEFKYLMC